MEKKLINVRCRNNGETIEAEIGCKISDVLPLLNLNMPLPPMVVKVNNRVVGLNYRLFGNKTLEFLDITSEAGMRAYTKTLYMVLCKAVHDLYPDSRVKIEFSVCNGYFCRLFLGRDVTPDDANDIRQKMQEIIAADYHIHRHQQPTEDVIKRLEERGETSKVNLIKSLGEMYTTFYSLDDYSDNYYGPVLTRTSLLTTFGLEMFADGLLLRVPQRGEPTKLAPFVKQNKMLEVFQQYHDWQEKMGIGTVGDLNKAILTGHSNDMINVFEALQDKQLMRVADDIKSRHNIKVVLIAGPSSSGKTTTCKRLSVQLITNGMWPVGISLDDYFLDREATPKDENGEYDFESLYALNLELFNQNLSDLIEGKEVELPRYNFVAGKSEMSGKKLRLKPNEVLVIEGIHALNPSLITQVHDSQIYRVYASALTTIMLDDHNYIHTTDNRLLRRMIRDHKYRGTSAQKTLHRWASVRAGENKWIFPYQENADAMINTAILFELAVIKTQAEPLLEQVPENSDEYSEAYRLREFLRYIKPMPENQIPPTSLLREFLGGSSFEY